MWKRRMAVALGLMVYELRAFGEGLQSAGYSVDLATMGELTLDAARLVALEMAWAFGRKSGQELAAARARERLAV